MDRAKELRAKIPEELVLQQFNVEALIRIILWVIEEEWECSVCMERSKSEILDI